MKKFSCLLIEDNELDAQVLISMLKQQGLFQQIDWCQTVAESLYHLATSSYDLIFLDMHLPDQLGTDFLRNTPHRPPVIVVTASVQYAAPCYDFDVTDYISKPLEMPRLQKAVNRVLSGNRKGLNNPYDNSIFFQANRQLKRFQFSDILFIEAHGAYAKVHTPQEVVVVSHAISWIEVELPASQFMRVQKSFIINLNHITAVEARYVWINTTKVSVGAQYVDLLQQFVRRDGPDSARHAGN